MSDLITPNRGSRDQVAPDQSLRHGGTLMRPGPSLVRSLGVRLGLASLVILLVTMTVYIGRDGFVDNSHPGEPLSLIDSIYYAATSLTTV